MVRIVADTSTLYSSEQAKQAGFSVSPLSVTIAGESYQEFDEITPEQFGATCPPAASLLLAWESWFISNSLRMRS